VKRSKQKHVGARLAALGLAAVVGVTACSEESPTSVGESVLPGAPVTLQIEIPWEEFASNLQVLGGYGAPSELGTGVLANGYAGTLNARSLMRFGSYPTAASVTDTAGTTVTDTDLTFVSGRVVARFRRAASSASDPVELSLGLMDESWHRPSASWTLAEDTIGSQIAWSAPGGGTVSPLVTATWTPIGGGDSVAFALDSAQIAAWEEEDARDLGARLDMVTAGHRVHVSSVGLTLIARPSVNPDTLIEVPVQNPELTFIYDPPAAPPAVGIRIGGAPSWRTVLDLAVPTTLTGPSELCDAVGCPVTLEPGEVSFAGLVLTSREPEGAYLPLDSLRVDARPVLDSDALPKAPLGSALVGGGGLGISGSFFSSDVGSTVEIPITPMIRDLISGTNPSTGLPYPNTLALLTPSEPLSIAYGSFYGPDAVEGLRPLLRLVVTVGPSVELP
jgi:hypothetical protein